MADSKPKTIQELMSGNPLIDAFMGGGPPPPRQQHPEAEVEAILASIDSCNDIEPLVDGVQIDLESIIGPSKRKNITTNDKNDDKNQNRRQVKLDTLAARLSRIKSLMYDERATSASSSSSFAKSFFSSSQAESCAASDLLHSLLLNDKRKQVFPKLLSSLQQLPFESRKAVASIFNYLLVCGCVYNEGASGNDSSYDEYHVTREVSESYTKTMNGFVTYVDEYYEEIMEPIVGGHYLGSVVRNEESKENDITENSILEVAQPIKTVDVALHCGGMLRSTLRHPRLYSNLVTKQNTPLFIFPFLDIFANQQNFEVASDALESLRLILSPPHSTPNMSEKVEPMMENSVASFLEREYEPLFIERFNVKLLSAQHANYITRRVSLQILSTILLTRTNYNIMVRYISNRSNLKTIMMLLRDPSAHIALEAFNVFKIFVVNPNKPEEIVRILADNKVKLVKYLTGLHQEKEKIDEQYKDEKALVIATLQQLE